MKNYTTTKNVIHLNFIGISKDGVYVYHNPTIKYSKEKERNNETKTIFEEIFGKKK